MSTYNRMGAAYIYLETLTLYMLYRCMYALLKTFTEQVALMHVYIYQLHVNIHMYVYVRDTSL